MDPNTQPPNTQPPTTQPPVMQPPSMPPLNSHPPDMQPANNNFNPASPPKSKKKILGIVLTVVAFVISSIVVRSILNNRPVSLPTNEESKAYVSSEHGFSIDFPGFPTTKHSNVEVEGKLVPVTQYSKDLNKGEQAYLVQVANYPIADFNVKGQERGVLDGAINGGAQSSGAKIVTSSNSGTHLGFPSAAAELSVTQDSKSYTMYALYFVKENDLYTILTIGVDKPTFDNFVATFKFN